MKAALFTLLALAAMAPRAHARGCTEHSYVVGHEHCSHFGTWSRDDDILRFWLDVGYFRHSYESQPFSLASEALSTATSDRLATAASGMLLRGLGGIGRVLYTGVELQIGGVPVISSTSPPPTSSFYVGLHAILGAHVSLFRFGFASELAAGFRYEDFEYCPDAGCMAIEASQTRRELEARVRLDAYVSPHWSVGIALGKSLIDHDDMQLLLYTSLHIRAMDGMW